MKKERRMLGLLMQQAEMAIQDLWNHIELNREKMGKDWKISDDEAEEWSYSLKHIFECCEEEIMINHVNSFSKKSDIGFTLTGWIKLAKEIKQEEKEDLPTGTL